MKVELINYTQDALNLLLTTKGTRLSHDENPADWDEQKKQEHLSYMLDTIQSSWEFCDYVFRISGVTRSFTHQFVRTRTGSYAQESMRIKDARNQEVKKPSKIEADELMSNRWDAAKDFVMDTYSALLDDGAATQDARGLLPTNITTSIIAKFNLRALHDMAERRLCTRTQGEYQDVFREMRQRVIEVHPWAADFINVYCINKAHCCFPRYGEKECPIYPSVLSNQVIAMKRKEITKAFESVRYEANPIPKNGKAM